MANDIRITEDAFRESLKDVVAVLSKLSAHCRTVEEIASMCQLATENDGQLRLLLMLMTQQARK